MPVHAMDPVRRTPYPGLRALVLLALGYAAVLAGCAGMQSRPDDASREAAPSARADRSPEAASPPARKFEEPGELDRLLDAKPLPLPAVKAAAAQAAPAAAAPKGPEPARGKGSFRIQIGAESDVDVAQAKKAEYEKLLGGQVDVVFDAPYYKLRWGFFDTKQDAEDKLLELSDQKIQGFVVKQ